MSAVSAAVVAAYINAYGPVDDRDLDDVIRLAEIDEERREAYWQGYRAGYDDGAFKGVSLAISSGADWRAEAQTFGEIQQARKCRAAMCDSSPRSGDFPERAA